MTVSVIIPCYNAETYLAPCLESVLAQSHRQIEVIVIDDGSKDGTLEIARGFAKRDARIRVLHQENAGVCAARNAGLDVATGEWVAFVDGDDLLPPDAISTLLSACTDDVDMVVGAHETFDEAGEHTVFWPETRWMDLPIDKKKHAVALRLIEGDSVLNIMCNKLHRRAHLAREGLRLTPGLKLAEDALFNLEAALSCRDLAYVNRITYRYRTHAQSATQARRESEFDAHRAWFAAMRSMLERKGVMEQFYPAYVSSVVLRLYKDGGAGHVVRAFSSAAKPFLVCGGMNMARMRPGARALLRLCETGKYAVVYPFILPFEIVERKVKAAAFRLRAKKEMPR